MSLRYREPYDISNWKLNPIPIAGRYPKHELSDASERYIIKLAAYKQNGLEVPYHVSEYISCRLIKSLGYNVQDVFMADFHGQPGCLIKIFDDPLITFTGLGTSTLSGENMIYDLDALGDLFHEGRFHSNFSEYLWDTFLCDAFINNLDRHPNNWGFFKRDGIYMQAPIFDCGSSLYSVNAFSLIKMDDMDSYISKFGNSAISYKGERRSFKDIIINEKSISFTSRLHAFVSRIGGIDYSCMENVRKYWPKYSEYVDFINAFIIRQVKWFESLI